MGDFFSLGEASMALGHHDEAFNAYRRSMQEEPSSLPSVYNTAYAAGKLGRSEAELLFRRAVELFENQQSSSGGRADANALAAMACAYTAIKRPDKALRCLRNARRAAAASETATFFSPSAYTYVPKTEFLDEVGSRIEEIEREYKDALAGPTSPIILTAMKSQGEFVLTFKKGEMARRRTARTVSGVVDLLSGVGMDRPSAARYAEMLSRGHPVLLTVDLDPDLVFSAED